METQHQRQEQLAAENRHNLTELFSMQQKMQVDLTQQYQQLADEQNKQLNKFIEVQENRCKTIEERQLGTDELVKTVESDMASMKCLLQMSLRRGTQEQMLKDLLAAKCSFTGVMKTPGGRAPHLPQTAKPLPYDGKSSWEAYKLQFEMLAQLNGWNEMQKATYLAVSLRGTDLTILTNLSIKQHSEYKSLLPALDNNFGTAHQTS